VTVSTDFSPQLPQVGDNIDRPFTAALNALLLFILGLHIDEAAQAGRIQPATFVENLNVETGGVGLTIHKKYTPDQVIVGAEQIRFAAMAVSAQAIDRALDDTFVAKNPQSDAEIDHARSIMYQIRNCFAHDPQAPTWRIKKTAYQRILKVPAIGLEWEGNVLSGQALSPVHIGGYEGYVRLMQFSCQQISQHEATQNQDVVQ